MSEAIIKAVVSGLCFTLVSTTDLKNPIPMLHLKWIKSECVRGNVGINSF